MKKERIYKSSKLAGTTLIEVVIALSLIATIFVIGSRLWIQAVVANSPKRSFEIRTFMKSLLIEDIENQGLGESKHNFKGYSCTRSITYYQENPRLMLIEVECESSLGKTEKRKRIVPNKEN